MFTKMTIFKIPDLLAFMKVEKDSSIFSNLKLIFKSYTTRFLQYWKQALLFDKQNKNIVLLRSEPMLKWGSTNNKSVYFGGKILSLQ